MAPPPLRSDFSTREAWVAAKLVWKSATREVRLEKRRAYERERWHNDPKQRERMRLKTQRHREKNQDAARERRKRWYATEAGLAARKAGEKRRRANLPPERKAAIKRKARERDKTNASRVVMRRVRSRLREITRTQMRSKRTAELIGCSPFELRAHIESLFVAGMSWENRSEWHIDHKRPCSSFDMTKPEDVAACFHYSNLQPLWALDNLRKAAKYERPTTMNSKPVAAS
jgi:hypothetical protein